jgi:hypothetical protein
MSEGVASEYQDCRVVDSVLPDRRGEQQTRHSRGGGNATQNYVRWNRDTDQNISTIARHRDDKGHKCSSSQKEIDLEKGEVLDADAELMRMDSGMPPGTRRGGNGKGKEEKHEDHDAD